MDNPQIAGLYWWQGESANSKIRKGRRAQMDDQQLSNCTGSGTRLPLHRPSANMARSA